jgi:D-alanyl-D-alanine carboxypeptidase
LILSVVKIDVAAADGKKAAAVVDFSNGKKFVFENRMNDKRHPASLTKMMTVYLLFEAIQNGKIGFGTEFVVSKLASRQMPSKINLSVGERITVLNLIKALIVQSANDAAVVAAEGLCGSVSNFCRLMNAKALSLGMRNTHFENPSGVPNSKQISTAKDMMILGMALYCNFPQFWHFFSLKSFKYKGRVYGAHCKILRWYRGADGGKTGYTCASGFNLFVTANRRYKRKLSKRVFVVVMGFGSGKSRDLYAASLMNKYLPSNETGTSATSNPRKFARIEVPTESSKTKSNNFTIAKKLAPKVVPKVAPKKPAAKNVIKKQTEPIIQTIDEISVKEIIANERISEAFLDELYELDEDVINVEDEMLVEAKK